MSDSLIHADSNESRGQRRAAQQSQAAALIALLSRTAEGDTRSFAALYDQTCARVYGVALQVLRDTGFAEETTQEVYLQVWKSARSFDPTNGTALAWLTTLAHRRAVDRVRSEQTHTKRGAVYATRTHLSAFDPVAEAAIDRIERRRIKEGVASLSDTQRESITLAYYRGLTYREVAECLGVPVPTIKSRIRAALIELCESLDTPNPPKAFHALNEICTDTID